jgi:AcrR family transcriptional regulator
MKPRPSSSRIRWVRPPRQKRSERTLHRLLDAAERLLDRKTFDELTVQDVVKAAKSSVGSFYARFADKEALLAALYDRHQEEVGATVSAAVDRERWRGTPLPEIVREIVRFTLRLYRSHRGLLRALVLRGHARPDPRYRDPKQRSRTAIAEVGALLASRSEEIGHPDPKLAASLGYLSVLATAREKLLFGDSTASAVAVSDHELEEELTRAYLAYLHVKPPRGAARQKPTRRAHGRNS